MSVDFAIVSMGSAIMLAGGRPARHSKFLKMDFRWPSQKEKPPINGPNPASAPAAHLSSND